MSTFAVIMAGGKGERFWPESRENRPKQMLRLFSDDTMIELTVERLTPMIPPENIFILTNMNYVESLRKLLPQVPVENIVGEPARRDTAPCIALAAGLVAGKDPDATMIVLPADSMIRNAHAYRQDLMLAVENAENGICTIGIHPTEPSPNFGYIEAADSGKTAAVKRFVEKPSVEKATEMLKQKNYYWNSGIFIWKASTILAELKKHVPALAEFAEIIAEKRYDGDFVKFMEEKFPQLPKISIDYAVMEKAEKIQVVQSSFDWDDVGNWCALRNQIEADPSSNIVRGNVQLLNCSNNIVFCNDKDHLIAAIDMQGTVIVHSENVTLVCSENSTGKIKELLNSINQPDQIKRYL